MTEPRDKGNWAEHVERLDVGEIDEEALNLNVTGRRPTGPLQGFGQMWKKTYRVPVASHEPEDVITTWKADYGEFWPDHSRFYAPITGIQPGEVGVINSRQGPVKLSTGVLVLYSDDTSFTYMTPQGHPFAGFITFSSYTIDGGTVAQVELLLRPNDPLYEVGFKLYGSRAEDKMWQQTLKALATRLGVDDDVDTTVECLDPKRQWRRFGNIRHNSVIRTMVRKPIGWKRRSKRS